MDAKPVKVIEYFNGEKQNLIPLFQRRYTWTAKNWREFWEDVRELYESDLQDSHFLGAIVSAPFKSQPVGVNKFLIIDGQQRLTTIACFLVALRSVADERTADRISDYLWNRHQRGAPDFLKILPTQGDRAAFNSLVSTPSAPQDREHALVKAFLFFADRFNRARDAQGNNFDIERLFQLICSNLEVVMINLGESDDPYLIFESLNNKGEPLSQADLVRNYVLMRFQHSAEDGGQQETVYNDYWRPLEQLLEERITDFLGHFVAKEGLNVKKKAVYSAVKNRMKKLTTEEAVISFVSQLAEHGAHYAKFLAPSLESDTLTRKHLNSFIVFEISACYPLLLKLYQLHSKETIGQGELRNGLVIVESYLLRRFVCNVPTNSLNRLFTGWAGDCPDDEPVAWLYKQLSEADGNKRWPDDDEFKENLLTQDLYGSRRQVCKYLLEQLEQSFKHKEKVDTSSATIEHIMPQTLNNEWIADLGDSAEEIHRSLLGTLGNLTLTGYNSELGNSDFAAKKAFLEQSHFELNRRVSQASQWTLKEIHERAEDLADRAIKIWGRAELATSIGI